MRDTGRRSMSASEGSGQSCTRFCTDPPYGVEYDPAWRARAGVNLNREKLGVARNDDRADWRAATGISGEPLTRVPAMPGTRESRRKHECASSHASSACPNSSEGIMNTAVHMVSFHRRQLCASPHLSRLQQSSPRLGVDGNRRNCLQPCQSVVKGRDQLTVIDRLAQHRKRAGLLGPSLGHSVSVPGQH